MAEEGCKCAEVHLLGGRKSVVSLLAAYEAGHMDCVNRLIKETSHRKGKQSCLDAILGASDRGYAQLVEILLESGASVNYEDREGRTPVMMAAKNNHSETVRLLLKFNANVGRHDRDGNTAFSYAAQNGHTETLGVLLEAVETNSSIGINQLELRWKLNNYLHEAVCKRFPDTIELLLKKGADPNYRKSGKTLLHAIASPVQLHYPLLAIWQDDKENPLWQDDNETNLKIIKTLLLHGTDVRTTDLSPEEVALLGRNCNFFWPLQVELRLIYASGATYSHQNIGTGQFIPQFILDEKTPLVALTHLCRTRIRSHLLSPSGGDRSNLFIALPQLPLPEKFKKFLVFDLDISKTPENILKQLMTMAPYSDNELMKEDLEYILQRLPDMDIIQDRSEGLVYFTKK